MENSIIGMFKGIPAISFGIMKMPYDEKEIIQKASYYWSGKQYEDCGEHMFYSGSYHLIPDTEELSDMDVFMLKSKYKYLVDENEIRKQYKYVFVKVLDVK